MDELAQLYKFEYEVQTADIDERAIRSPDPRELVMLLGKAKRDAILQRFPGQQGLLITCDQVVVHQVSDAAGLTESRM